MYIFPLRNSICECSLETVFAPSDFILTSAISPRPTKQNALLDYVEIKILF